MRRASKGFTLIEVLVALGIMALMAALSWRGVDTLLRSRAVLQSHSAQSTLVSTVLSQWRADLDATTKLPGLETASGMDWDGRVMRLTRRSTELSADGSDTGVWVVGWALRGAASGTNAKWLRWQSPTLRSMADVRKAWAEVAVWAQTSTADSRLRETPLLDLSALQIFYYRDNAWSNPLSSAGTAGNTPNTNVAGPPALLDSGTGTGTATPVTASANNAPSTALPDAVRLVLQAPQGADNAAFRGNLTLDWLRPTWSVGRT